MKRLLFIPFLLPLSMLAQIVDVGNIIIPFDTESGKYRYVFVEDMPGMSADTLYQNISTYLVSKFHENKPVYNSPTEGVQVLGNSSVTVSMKMPLSKNEMLYSCPAIFIV